MTAGKDRQTAKKVRNGATDKNNHPQEQQAANATMSEGSNPSTPAMHGGASLPKI